ncbi:DNA recombination protein RmuC [uncultured Prevotella sp.]|uniref:DNA recombination protein RmuC n=1 Tax=uncultured Prevotella sp. TaxID=159272 RepID=UPI0026167470|nr:DNA recombination protein RmuC [uncultured Prevotella sp.]
MTSFLFFIAGFLIAVVVMMIVSQRNVAALKENSARLSNEAAASRREADMLRSQLGDAREDAERRLTELRRQYERLMAENERKHAEERAGREQLMEKQFAERLQLLQEQLRTTTEKLLKQRADELDKSNRNQMDSIIAPLKAVMTEMKKSMDDNRESFTRSTASLGEQIRQMHATTASLGAEAEKLSRALQTGPKIQGDFGEMKLNDLLDKFGFTKGVEYDVQYTMRDAKGNLIHNDDTNDMMRPDVVLHYPDHKDVIIDSKASLTAFFNYVNAENDDERRKALDEHVRSVRRHVDELSAKNYAKYSMEGGTTLDFVIMFVPQEAAMQLAVSADPSLWNYAFERKVVITGEQNLFSLLRLLQIAWTQQRQADNQELVFGLADTLIERVGLFIERFDKIGKNIDAVQKSFDDARRAIKGNQSFIVSARKLVEMGAKENPRRPLPDVSPDDDMLPET